MTRFEWREQARAEVHATALWRLLQVWLPAALVFFICLRRMRRYRVV